MAIVEIVSHVLCGILLKVISVAALMRFIYLGFEVVKTLGRRSPTARPVMGRDGTVQDSGIEEIVFVGGVNAALSLPLIIIS
jgi:hypothetical protein